MQNVSNLSCTRRTDVVLNGMRRTAQPVHFRHQNAQSYILLTSSSLSRNREAGEVGAAGAVRSGHGCAAKRRGTG